MSRNRTAAPECGISVPQAGVPAPLFGTLLGNEKRRYVAAIHAAFDQDYAPMERAFRRLIERTLRR